MSPSTGQENSCRPDADRSVVGVAFPIAVPGLYDYRIPQSLLGKVLPGTPLLVELRKRPIWGVAVELKSRSECAVLKDVIAARDEHWTDASRSLIKLYQWIAAYYHCELGRVFRPLVSKGIIAASSKTITVYTPDSIGSVRLTPGQEAALRALAACDRPLTKKEMEERFGIKSSMVAALCKLKVLKQDKKIVLREALELGVEAPPERVILTEEQSLAVETIAEKFGHPDKPFLLHGITGSGKTHIYTELTRRALGRGMSAIVLVPEISLTPQTIMRFKAAVGDTIAVIHSHMSDGERRDGLRELVTGAKKLVIGVRSAVLAPMDAVGLIVVDEEHDASYKQTEMDPRYNARDVAIMRAHFQKALVVLGSATPSLESWQNAQNGKYHLLKLARRFGPARLPKVSIVDMNDEHRNNNWTVLSRFLEERMRQCLDSRRQILLLLNRRGYSTILICKCCGFTHHCPNCSVTLRYHLIGRSLKCHLCGHEAAAPDTCPVCRGEQMKYKGTGIQKAEELIAAKFPQARIIRMDRDTTRRKGSHHFILDAFAKRDADILLGTQMVAKGLNFPAVALVGVLQADTGLLVPDFRASERTFQLLTQVAGRAGRADDLGEVVIQTYFPNDPAIQTASRHDYDDFCAKELPGRRELRYPPFGKLARVLVTGTQEHIVKSEMEKLARSIDAPASCVTLLGPSPAVISKIGNEYRYSFLLKAESPKRLAEVLSQVRFCEKRLPKPVRLIIDVDPMHML